MILMVNNTENDSQVQKINRVEHDHTQQRIPRIDIRGLPNYNFINLFMEYIGDKRSYHEYNYINAKSMLVATTLGRVYARTPGIQGEPYPKPLRANDMNVIIGNSGTGKSVSHDEAKDIQETIMGKDIFIPRCAPETLAKELSDIKVITQLERPKGNKGEDRDSESEDPEDKTSKKHKEISIEIELPAVRYPRCWRVFWLGEFGSFLADTNKSYMEGIIEDFCDYYSGNIETKTIKGDTKLSNIKFMFRDDLFFAVNGSMTPMSLMYITIEMIKKGLMRITFYDGSDLPQKDIPPDADIEAIQNKTGNLLEKTEQHKKTKGTKKDDYRKRCIIKCGAILDSLLKDQILEVDISEEAEALILNREKAMLRQFGNDRYILMLISRDLEKIFKECIAVELGNVPYYLISNKDRLADKEITITETLKDLENTDGFYAALNEFDISKIDNEHRIRKLTVTPETARFVLKMFDRIYFPSMVSIVDKIREQDRKVNKTTLEKVIRVFNDAPNLSKDIVIQMYRESFDRFEKQQRAQIKQLEKGNLIDKEKQIQSLEEYIQEEKENTQNNIEYFTKLDERFNITSLTSRQLQKKLQKEDTGDLDKACLSMVKANSLIEFKQGKSITYVYLPTNSDEFKLPENNYVNYEGTDSYSTGLVIERVLTPNVVTGESLVSDLTEAELNESIEKVQKVLELEGKSPKKQETITESIEAYL
jgi:hypothetical protein